MKILVSVDDGSKEDIKIAKLCLKYGVKAVFYWPVDMYGLSIQKGWDSLNPKDEEWIAQNFEIGSHTISHRYLTKIPLEDAVDEVIESRKMLQKKYKQDVNRFCYPRGYYSEPIKQAVKDAGYVSARTTAIGNITTPKDYFEEPTSVHIGCPVRPEYENKGWYGYAIDLWNKAKTQESKGIPTQYTMWGHGWEISRYRCWDEVEQLIKTVAKG